MSSDLAVEAEGLERVFKAASAPLTALTSR